MLNICNGEHQLLSNFNTIANAPQGVARLRELILTLAVQGKLVPQDASDEPASELLKKIRLEKERLIAGGKIKKDKPLVVITEEEKSFDLPMGWVWARLGTLANFIDYRGKTPEKTISGVPLITAKNVRKGFINRDPQEFIAESAYEGWMTRGIPRVGDLLFTTEAPLGNIAAIDIQEKFALAQRVICFGLYELKMSGLLLTCLQSQWVQKELVDQASGVTAQGIKSSRLQLIPVPVPPLAEQSRIVTRVEELMRLCDALEEKGRLEQTQHQQLLQALLDSLTQNQSAQELAQNWQRLSQHFDLLIDRPEAVDALEQTILQLAVRGLLVPQDANDEPASELLKKIRFEKDGLIAEGRIKKDKPLAAIVENEKPFELPRGWEWVRFDELIHPLKPIAYGVLVPGPDVENGVPFVRIADLSVNDPPLRPEKTIGLEVDAQFQRTRLVGGEILMGVVGSIGKLGIVPESWAGANIARAICRIVPADSGLRNFVLFLLQTKYMQDSFAGDARTLAQPTLNIGLIRAALTPMPPPAEQTRIVTRVTELRALCQQLRERLTKARSTQAQLAQAWVEQAAA